MKEGATLYAQRINYGQSEIWLEADGRELTQRRKLATNEVVNVTRRYCTPEVFQTFYVDYHIAVGHVAKLAVANLDKIVAELRLKTSVPTNALVLTNVAEEISMSTLPCSQQLSPPWAESTLDHLSCLSPK